MSESLCLSIEKYFSELPDPRGERNRRHKLMDMMVIALCGMLSSADDFVSIEEYGQAKEEWLRQYLELPNGIPSHDTFSRLFAALDSEALQESFRHWARYLVDQTEQIAIDGKRQCGSHNNGEYPPCSVNAYSVEQGLVLMQTSTADKRGELAGIKQMLKLLELKGCLVSLDAGGSYQEVSDQIVDRGGDYLLAVKSNQPSLYEQLDQVFEDHRVHETASCAEFSHGRGEQRHAWVCHDIEHLSAAANWSKCATVGMVQRIYRQGKAERAEHRYYISSRRLDAAQLAERVRSHWGIENGLHWVLDVAFDEDRSRARAGQCAANLVVLRQWAFNLLKQENSRRLGIKNKRKKAGWDMNYLTTLLRLA